jgi:DNA-binding NtrC family response regulator
MKLIVVNGIHGFKPRILKELEYCLHQLEVVVTETIDDLLEILDAVKHGIVFVDCSVQEFDVWTLSALLNSNHFNYRSLSTYLIKESCFHDYSPALAKLNNIALISISEVSAVVASALSSVNASGALDKTHEKPSLLIVEDDPILAEQTRIILSSLFETDIAPTADMGLRLWDEKRHDLVLLDFMLPDFNGDKLLELIRTINPLQPVIMLTGMNDEKLVEKLIFNGATDYVIKPTSPKLLIAKCRKALGLYAFEQNSDFLKGLNNSATELLYELEIAIQENDREKALVTINNLKKILPMVKSQ